MSEALGWPRLTLWASAGNPFTQMNLQVTLECPHLRGVVKQEMAAACPVEERLTDGPRSALGIM